jgi:hypothetical protein
MVRIFGQKKRLNIPYESLSFIFLRRQSLGFLNPKTVGILKPIQNGHVMHDIVFSNVTIHEHTHLVCLLLAVCKICHLHNSHL